MVIYRNIYICEYIWFNIQIHFFCQLRENLSPDILIAMSTSLSIEIFQCHSPVERTGIMEKMPETEYIQVSCEYLTVPESKKNFKLINIPTAVGLYQRIPEFN